SSTSPRHTCPASSRRRTGWTRREPGASSIGAADLTQVGAVRDRAADRLDRPVADDEVEVGAFRAERVVAGLADLRARLPPTVLPADDVRLQTLVQLGSRADAALRRLDSHPVAGANAARGGRDGAELDLRVSGSSTQTREPAMLALAELRGLRAGQDQGIAPGHVRARDGTDQRLDMIWQRRVTVLQERLGVQLDLARRRREAVRYSVLLLGVLAVARLERDPHPARALAERLQGLPPTSDIGMGEEQVGPESDQSPHRIRSLLEDGAIHLVRGDPTPA